MLKIQVKLFTGPPTTQTWLTPFWTPSDSENFPLGAYTIHSGVLVQTLNSLVNSQTSDLHFRILMEFLGDISVWRTAGMKEC
jgi:hypothetical protein